MLKIRPPLCFMIIALIIISMGIASATRIYGDLINAEDFEKTNETILKIEGATALQVIANDNYSVELLPGQYRIYAIKYDRGKVVFYSKDTVNVSGENMRFDIVLLPITDFENQIKITNNTVLDDLDNNTAKNMLNPKTDGSNLGSNTAFLILAGLIVIIIFILKKGQGNTLRDKQEKENVENKIDEDEEIQRIVKILESFDGRILQRELREILNYSETKMSLVISEMEVSGLIKRIKKGRENILKLIKSNNK